MSGFFSCRYDEGREQATPCRLILLFRSFRTVLYAAALIFLFSLLASSAHSDLSFLFFFRLFHRIASSPTTGLLLHGEFRQTFSFIHWVLFRMSGEQLKQYGVVVTDDEARWGSRVTVYEEGSLLGLEAGLWGLFDPHEHTLKGDFVRRSLRYEHVHKGVVVVVLLLHVKGL